MVEEFDGGVWRIEDGVLHLDIPKLLERLGIPDTEENRDLAIKTALEVAQEQMPEIPRIVLL